MNNAAGMVKKNFLIHITMAILCALVTFVGNEYLGSILGAVIFITFVIMQYGDGCDRGERACTLSATMERLASEGKQPDAHMLAQSYKPTRAIAAVLWSSVPLALLAAVNLILADPNSVSENLLGFITRIVFLPAAWLSRLMTTLVGADYTGTMNAGASVVSTMNIQGGIDIVAAANGVKGITEYCFAYDLHYLTWLRVMYIPIAFASPVAMMIGYLQGPKLRVKKLAEIEKGTRRKRKKLKVFGSKPKQPRSQRPEV